MYKHSKLDFDLLLEAIDRLESVFAVYDKDFSLIYANESARQAWPDFYNGLAKGQSHFEAMRNEIRTQFPDLPDDQIDQFTEFSLGVVRPGGKGELSTRNGRTYQTHHEKLGTVGTVGIGVDLTDLKAHQKRLKELAQLNHLLANNDELTGLSNRRHFVAQIDQLVEQSEGTKAPFTLGLLDLDGFKRVNDVYGHPVGDDLLKEVGQRMSQILDDDDILARLGGDEFGFVTTRATTESEIHDLSSELVERLADPYLLQSDQVHVSASIGVATFPDAATDRALLLKRADYALYHSKHNASGSPVVFSTHHEERISRQAKLNLAFREADWDKELYLEFQPIFDLQSGQIRAVEALARWHSEKLGLVRPDQFIAIAEHSGLITQVSQVLFRKALNAMQSWPEHVRLSFNLSPYEIASDGHAETLMAQIDNAGTNPKRVVFELTESAMIQDTQLVSNVLQSFKRRGIRIALDDFGSGYSSLSHLAKMPIDIVKIDRSFLSDLTRKKRNHALLNGIVQLCRDMSLLTVLEGVETDFHMRMVRETELDLVQGYLFSRPLGETCIRELLLDADQAGLWNNAQAASA